MKTEDLETLAHVLGHVKNRVKFRLDLADKNSVHNAFYSYVNSFPPGEREQFKTPENVVNHVLVNLWRDLWEQAKRFNLFDPRPVVEYIEKLEAVAYQVETGRLPKYDAMKILGVAE